MPIINTTLDAAGALLQGENNSGGAEDGWRHGQGRKEVNRRVNGGGNVMVLSAAADAAVACLLCFGTLSVPVRAQAGAGLRNRITNPYH